MRKMPDDTLILTHVIFRHGERTPVKEHHYSNDPHVDLDFSPYGPGQLTNVGKRTMYELGRLLRGLYDKYLGDEYRPKYVDALTTNYDRTKVSLQLVLASLFPPKGENVWNDTLNWQPIPYNCLPFEHDDILGTCIQNPEFMKAYKAQFESNEAKELFKKYNDLLVYLRKCTGIPLKTTREAWFLLGTLLTEQEFGLTLPDWTTSIFPEKLMEFALNEYSMHSATKQLKSLILGKLLQKILNDTNAKISGNSEQKIHLYSGHDYNIAHPLIFFGLMYPHIANYGSCLVLEVHQIDNNHAFKLRYRESKLHELEYLTFRNGKDILPLETFQEMVKDWTN